MELEHEQQSGQAAIAIIKLDWIKVVALEVEIWIYPRQYSQKERFQQIDMDYKTKEGSWSFLI